MEVGVKELRDHLSKYLEQVKAGAEIIVTEHDRAIARLVALGHERTIDRLIAEGIVTRAVAVKRNAPKGRVKATTAVSDLVAEQRR